MNPVTWVKDKFQVQTPERQKQIVIAVLAALMLLFAYVIISAFSEEPKQRQPRGDNRIKYDLLTGREAENLGINAIAAQLEMINKRIQRVEEGAIGQRTPGAPGPDGAEGGGEGAAEFDIGWESLAEDPKLSEEDKQLLLEIKQRREDGGRRRAIDTDKPGKERKVSDIATGTVISPPVEPIQVVQAPKIVIPPAKLNNGAKIKSFSEKRTQEASTEDGEEKPSERGSQSGDKKGPERNINDTSTITLPAGSIIGGTLITGMDASSANSAKREPFPALLRIKQEAILPNRYSMDIRECFMIASGYGDLSSERAYLRAEAISCVKEDGTILESSVDAYAVGEDGKTGIRGRVVSKEGAMIARGLLSGFLSGLSTAMKPARIPVMSLNPEEGFQTERPDASVVAEQSMLSGISSASTEIAKYYLDMAKNMFPVIEIDAGRKVDFIVSRGARLSGNSNAMNNLQGGGMNPNQGYNYPMQQPGMRGGVMNQMQNFNQFGPMQ